MITIERMRELWPLEKKAKWFNGVCEIPTDAPRSTLLTGKQVQKAYEMTESVTRKVFESCPLVKRPILPPMAKRLPGDPLLGSDFPIRTEWLTYDQVVERYGDKKRWGQYIIGQQWTYDQLQQMKNNNTKKEDKMTNEQEMKKTEDQIKVLEELKVDLQKKIDEEKPESILKGRHVYCKTQEQWDHLDGLTGDWSNEKGLRPQYFDVYKNACMCDFNGRKTYTYLGYGSVRFIHYSEACKLLGVDEVKIPLKKGDKVRVRDQEGKPWKPAFFIRNDGDSWYPFRVVFSGREDVYEYCERFEWDDADLERGIDDA